MQILNVCLCCREGEWGENKRNPWENLNRKQIADDGGGGLDWGRWVKQRNINCMSRSELRTFLQRCF